jgi:hypothetical protein
VRYLPAYVQVHGPGAYWVWTRLAWLRRLYRRWDPKRSGVFGDRARAPSGARGSG